MDDLFIKNAKIVLADKVIDNGGVLVTKGKIKEIVTENEECTAKEVLDIGGKYLFPGFIDSHVHLDEPGYQHREDFYTGTEAAACGGITTIIDMPLNNKPPVYNKKIFNEKYNIVKNKALVDYGFWGALLNYNLNELDELNDAGALGFKCFMCEPGDDYTSLTLDEIEKSLQIIKKFNGVAGFHCEDYEIIQTLENEKLLNKKFTARDYLDSRPVQAELKATKDVLNIAEKTGCRIHICHVSDPLVAEEIKIAKENGVKVTAETCAHYLIFSEEDLINKGALYKCSPPLRKKSSRDQMWKYLADGTIDSICSDHSPATLEEKNKDTKGIFSAWGGMSSIQSTFQVIFNYLVVEKNLSPTLISKIFSENPAKIFGIFGQKGAIKPGFDADFTIVDADKEWEITRESLKTKIKESAFVGLKGKGIAIGTILRGKLISRDGEVIANHRNGHILKKSR